MSKFKRVVITNDILRNMTKENKAKLKALELETLKAKYPSMNPNYLPSTEWSDNSANSLTKSIIFYINATGNQAERIGNQGQYREGNKIQVGTGEIAYTKQLPGKWTPGQGTKGTADISATINGKSVKIEVKYKADRQSDAQKQYQEKIESAKGIYYIARDFDTFVEWYDTLLC
jgi:hypothetical protein